MVRNYRQFRTNLQFYTQNDDVIIPGDYIIEIYNWHHFLPIQIYRNEIMQGFAWSDFLIEFEYYLTGFPEPVPDLWEAPRNALIGYGQIIEQTDSSGIPTFMGQQINTGFGHNGSNNRPNPPIIGIKTNINFSPPNVNFYHAREEQSSYNNNNTISFLLRPEFGGIIQDDFVMWIFNSTFWQYSPNGTFFELLYNDYERWISSLNNSIFPQYIRNMRNLFRHTFDNTLTDFNYGFNDNLFLPGQVGFRFISRQWEQNNIFLTRYPSITGV
jgi:hypothetical protein